MNESEFGVVAVSLNNSAQKRSREVLVGFEPTNFRDGMGRRYINRKSFNRSN